jgi:DNA-binding transcriptional ArsR family regulator
VLHKPGNFGLRPAWAAGVRSRLPGAQREFLEQAFQFLPVPLPWIHQLNGSKDAQFALEALGRMAPSRRLAALMFVQDTTPAEVELLNQIAAHAAWTAAEVDQLRSLIHQRGFYAITPATVQGICQAWSRLEEFGEKILTALNTYYQVFFAEEEQRIRPELALALAQAQERAVDVSLPRLLDELSRGVQFDALLPGGEMILVPSYWSSPLVFYNRLNTGQTIMLFGCRQGSDPLVPGIALPGGLVVGLKALADPSRLRILHDLAEQPLTPNELARRLRLRAPTVIHHLNALRLAGLVQVILQEQGERRYALRREALNAVSASLNDFLMSSS